MSQQYGASQAGSASDYEPSRDSLPGWSSSASDSVDGEEPSARIALMRSTPESEQMLRDLFRSDGCGCDESTDERGAEESGEGVSISEFVRAYDAIPNVLRAAGSTGKFTKNARGGLVSAAVGEARP